MKKLLSYKYLMLVPFGDGEYKTVYKLTILKISFFGLFRKKVKMNYQISMFGSISEHEKHWDNLIESGQAL
jgi:hypothetical protein